MNLESALKHVTEFELIPLLINIIFRSTPYPLSYLKEVAHSTTPLASQALTMVREEDGVSAYATAIHSPQSLASLLEVLGKLVQSSDSLCLLSLYSHYGIYVLLNLASVYIMEIKKGGNHRLYSALMRTYTSLLTLSIYLQRSVLLRHPGYQINLAMIPMFETRHPPPLPSIPPSPTSSSSLRSVLRAYLLSVLVL
jgi:hypothetical protein